MSDPLDDHRPFWRSHWPWIVVPILVGAGLLLALALAADGAYSPFQYAGD